MKYINFLLLLCLLSCSGSGENSAPNNIDKDTIQKENKDSTGLDLNQEPDVPKGWIQVEMNTITFLFEKIDMSCDIANESTEQRCSFKDTAFFNLWPGDWMEDKIIKPKSDEFEITKMLVQEVTAIGVDSERPIEVPYCVLSRWRKSTSNWIEIQPSNNEFRFEIPDNFDNQTLNFELNELKEGIKNSCGNEWFEEFKDTDNLNDIPFSETAIQYNYKIISREINSGKTFENIIVFFTPRSC